MSILAKIPPWITDKILAGEPALREDLLIIPKMEKLGWTVSFKNENWHNSAQFCYQNFHIWKASTRYYSEWRFGELTDDGFVNVKSFEDLESAIEYGKQIKV